MGDNRKVQRALSPETREVQSWQVELAQEILRIMVFLGPLLMLLVGSRMWDQLNSLSTFLTFFFYLFCYLLLVVVYRVSKIPYHFRAGFVALLSYAMGVFDLLSFGWGDDGRLYLLLFPFLVALLFQRREGIMALTLSVITLLTYGTAGILGMIPTVPGSSAADIGALLASLVTFTVIGAIVVMSQTYLVPRLTAALRQSHQLAAELEEKQKDLQSQTRALQQANLAFQRRAMYLEATALVSQAITTVFEPEALLQRAVNLITNFFGFYHAGVFLLDDSGDWALLKAASSAGGKQMLAAGHRLHRGEESMVGWVVEHRAARIALDVGKDAVHFVNPYLPATRSEMAVPLLAGGRLIGILDVQSTEEAAFDQDDVRALEALGGQLAIAIDNATRMRDEAALLEATSPFYRLSRRMAVARSNEQIYTAVLESVRDYSPDRALMVGLDPDGEQVTQAADLWSGTINLYDRPAPLADYIQEGRVPGMAMVLTEPLLVNDLLAPTSEIAMEHQEALRELSEQSGARGLVLVPVRTEGRPLGLLTISYLVPHAFTPAEEQFYRALGAMVAVSMERTQLVLEAQRRAEQERRLREFSDRMMGIWDFRTMMEHAAAGLRDLVRADGVMVAVETRTSKEGGQTQ